MSGASRTDETLIRDEAAARTPAARDALVAELERVVVASVAVTARALAVVAPDMTLLQWRALVVIDEAGAGIPVSGVAASLEAKMSATSRLVGRLRARGLVRATHARGDSRYTLLSLTSAGRDLRRQVVERRRSDLVASLRGVNLPQNAATTLFRVAGALGERP